MYLALTEHMMSTGDAPSTLSSVKLSSLVCRYAPATSAVATSRPSLASIMINNISASVKTVGDAVSSWGIGIAVPPVGNGAPFDSSTSFLIDGADGS